MPFARKPAGTLGFIAGFSAVMALMAAPARADAQSLTASVGVDHSVGNYGGTQDTSITVAPMSLRVGTGGLKLGATMAYVRINGSPSIVGGGGGPIVIDPDAPATIREGLGDLSLSASTDILDLPAIAVTLGGRVKLPTGDAALSTGKTDLKASVEASLTKGPVQPFVEVGYRMLGDPEGIELENGAVASVGTSVSLGLPSLILSYDYAAASRAGLGDSHSLFAGLSSSVLPRLRLTGYGTAGLSDGAPDYGVGLIVSLKAL